MRRGGKHGETLFHLWKLMQSDGKINNNNNNNNNNNSGYFATEISAAPRVPLARLAPPQMETIKGDKEMYTIKRNDESFDKKEVETNSSGWFRLFRKIYFKIFILFLSPKKPTDCAYFKYQRQQRLATASTPLPSLTAISPSS